MVLSPRQLGDPFVAKWVMERIRYAREIGDQGQVDELEALFDEMTLRRIIETGRRDLVADVFIHLKSSLFAPVQKYLLNNWLSWKGVIASWSALKIAELTPQDFRGVLTQFVELPGIVLDKNRLSGVFQAVAGMGKDAAHIAKALVAKVESEGEKRDWWDLLMEMVRATTSSGIDEGVTLLVRGLEEAQEEDEKRYLEASLSAAYEVVAPPLPYLQQVREMSAKHTG